MLWCRAIGRGCCAGDGVRWRGLVTASLGATIMIEEERLARCLAAHAPPSSPLPIVPHPMEAHITEYAAAPTPPPSPISPWPPPLPQIPSLPLPPLPSSLHLPPHVPTSLPLPSSPLPPLPVLLFIPPPVDRRMDIPEAELPPRKRLCLTAPISRYEVGESSTAAPRLTGGHRADYGFIDTTYAEIRRRRAEEVGYGLRDVWVDQTEAGEEALQARDQTHVDDHEGAGSSA
ncbi:hypothetical protein Tco_1239585 [Tanacetum coccineum]